MSKQPDPCIAVVTETFHPEVNGVANTLHYLTQGLLARDFKVQVIRPRHPEEAYRDDDGCTHLAVRGMPIPGYSEMRFGFPDKKRLLAQWRQHRPRAVYVATEGPLGWSAVSAARALKIPVVAGFHTNFHAYSRYYGLGFLAPLIRFYLRLFHNRCTRTLAPTEALRSDLLRSHVRAVSVLSRGVDCSRFSPVHRNPCLRQQWGVEAHQPVLIYVGRIAAEKNIELAVHTYQQIKLVQPKVKMVLVGDGPQRASLQQQHPELIFCGTRTGPELSQHIASGDVFLFPSVTDTFGNVVIEAMASGLAVVAFNEAAAGAHIVHQRSGMLAEQRARDSFVKHTMALMNRPTQLADIRRQARLHAETVSWTKIVDEFEQLLLNKPLVRESRLGKQNYSVL